MYGQGSGGLRLTGEYRGWPVLEAVWDKSVKTWDAAGLLKVPVGDEDEFGVEKSADEGGAGLGLGVGEVGKKGGLIEVEPPEEDANGTAADRGNRLLVSTLPSTNTGIYTEEEPSGERNPELLSPPTKSSSSRGEGSSSSSSFKSPLTNTAARAATAHARTTSNAPEPFDLPTRTDVIAAEAVAVAEGKNLRGGWVMSGLLPERSEPVGGASSSEYKDVDLEAGSTASFVERASEDRAPGSGTLTPITSGVLGFLGRRPSAETAHPAELPLPMSLPPTPPVPTFSPPPASTSPGPTEIPPPPARVKSPLSSSSPAPPVELGRPVTVPSADEPSADDSFDDVQLVGGRSALSHEDKGDEGELMDVNLGAEQR